MESIDVRKVRDDLGLTQEEFASLISVDRRTVINYEQGKVMPDSKKKLITLLVKSKKKSSDTNNENSSSNTDKNNDEGLLREITSLKNHILTLNELVSDKRNLLDIYKSEITSLKEELEQYKSK